MGKRTKGENAPTPKSPEWGTEEAMYNNWVANQHDYDDHDEYSKELDNSAREKGYKNHNDYLAKKNKAINGSAEDRIRWYQNHPEEVDELSYEGAPHHDKVTGIDKEHYIEHPEDIRSLVYGRMAEEQKRAAILKAIPHEQEAYVLTKAQELIRENPDKITNLDTAKEIVRQETIKGPNWKSSTEKDRKPVQQNSHEEEDHNKEESGSKTTTTPGDVPPKNPETITSDETDSETEKKPLQKAFRVMQKHIDVCFEKAEDLVEASQEFESTEEYKIIKEKYEESIEEIKKNFPRSEWGDKMQKKTQEFYEILNRVYGNWTNSHTDELKKSIEETINKIVQSFKNLNLAINVPSKKFEFKYENESDANNKNAVPSDKQGDEGQKPKNSS